MLHIHNGDSAANIAKQSSLPGEHVAWRESLITGPTPSGLSEDDWRTTRSEHLSAAYGVDIEECRRSLLHQEETLASFSQHDEVVLWFEHDLFCQVHLIYLLNWFSNRDLGNTKLSLICIGEFPGKENFRGLGELNAEQLASLFPAREQVTDKVLSLATAAWRAYCSTNPTDIENILRMDTACLPWLESALAAHLKRFPSTKNGLGLIENRALELIAAGLNNFTDLFSRFGAVEPIYGLGDSQFWLGLQRLSIAAKPLLAKANGKSQGEKNGEASYQVQTSEINRDAKLELTGLGRSVLENEADFVALNGIDLWLGGVQLNNQNDLWRWDEHSQTIVSSSS